MKIAYKEWNPTARVEELVFTAENIIEEYSANGYTLTLRQLYYQFVARDIIENSERSYKNLGNHINNARLAGMISWRAIEDRNRGHYAPWTDEEITSPVRSLPHYIRFDRWARMDTYVEVWVEKEALGNVIQRACDPLLVPYLSCKGYLSASEAWRAGQRFKRKAEEGKDCVLIHLGDHDPSGIDMTRDNAERVALFSGEHVDVRRIALNMDQVREYQPPPNPTKLSDSRAKGYLKQFGKTSWELDALQPSMLEKLIQDEVRLFIDQDAWDCVGEEEAEMKNKLEAVYNNWDEVEELLEEIELRNE